MSRKEENDKSFIIVRMNEDGITNRRIAANLFLYSLDDEFIRTNVLRYYYYWYDGDYNKQQFVLA